MKDGVIDEVNALMVKIRVSIAVLEDESLLDKDRLEIAQETLQYASELYSMVYRVFSEENAKFKQVV